MHYFRSLLPYHSRSIKNENRHKKVLKHYVEVSFFEEDPPTHAALEALFNARIGSYGFTLSLAAVAHVTSSDKEAIFVARKPGCEPFLVEVSSQGWSGSAETKLSGDGWISIHVDLTEKEFHRIGLGRGADFQTAPPDTGWALHYITPKEFL